MLMTPAWTFLLNSRLVYPNAYLTSTFGYLIATSQLNIFVSKWVPYIAVLNTSYFSNIPYFDGQLILPAASAKNLGIWLLSYSTLGSWASTVKTDLEFNHSQDTFFPQILLFFSTLATSKQFNKAARVC